MYADPSLIRKHRVTLYLNDDEQNLVDAIVEYRGCEKAPLLREMLIDSAQRALAGDVNFAPATAEQEGPQMSLFRAA